MSPVSLSNTARTVLAGGLNAPDQTISLPDRLPVAAQRAVVKSMLKAGVVEEVVAGDDQPAWRTADSGELSIGVQKGPP
jgi:hypothetical protein